MTLGMSTLRPPVTERDHAVGPEHAPVTLVEYGDFECPHCGRAYPLIKRLREEFGDSLRFVFRHFPVTGIHPHALLAAQAAEEAAAQGRFWEMHDTLFENQEALEPNTLVQYAERIGLDLPRFRRALEERKHERRVWEDVESGEGSGVQWTPTFFINGERFGYAADLQTLREAIESAERRVVRGR